jgi:hypothetical protein
MPMKIIYKHYGLNYIGLGYHKGIVYAQNYSIHVQYLSLGISKKKWAPSFIY